MIALRPLLAPALRFALAAALLSAASASAQTLPQRILGSTDLHVNLLAWDHYQDKPVEEHGLARTATLIGAARAEAKNTLLVDNGDLLQGSPLGDVMARIRPLAPAAVHPAHEHRSTDEGGGLHTLKIGVIGFVPPQIMQWDRMNLAGRVAPLDIPTTARRLVPQMKAEGADLIVAIAHSGFEFGETVFFAENAVARIAEVRAVPLHDLPLLSAAAPFKTGGRGGAAKRFTSSARGIAHLAAQPNIRLVRDQGDGLAQYEIVR